MGEVEPLTPEEEGEIRRYVERRLFTSGVVSSKVAARLLATLDAALAALTGDADTPKPTCVDCGGDHPSGHPWHTPPVSSPIPSGSDLTAALERLRRLHPMDANLPIRAYAAGTDRYHVDCPVAQYLAALSASSASSPGLDVESLLNEWASMSHRGPFDRFVADRLARLSTPEPGQ